MPRHNSQAYDKLYYSEHKEIMAKQLQQNFLNVVKHRIFECCCGSIIKYNSKSNHFHSKKHLKYIETQDITQSSV
jgi:hypothetical protein